MSGQSRHEVLATFDHHVPNHYHQQQIELNRQACKTAAAVFLNTCPDGPDRDAALRHLHEAMMTANKAIMNPPMLKNAETFGPDHMQQAIGLGLVGQKV